MAAARGIRFRRLLSPDALASLVSSGADGAAVVASLVTHSTTFAAKTAHSQAKYIARKAAKHDLHLRVRPPSAAALAAVYLAKAPTKTLGLRADGLGLLLAHADVRAGTAPLLLDEVTGLLVAAAAERLGGLGAALHLFSGGCPPGVEIAHMATGWAGAPAGALAAITHVPLWLLARVGADEEGDHLPLSYVHHEVYVPEPPPPAEPAAAAALATRKRVRADRRAARPSRAAVKARLRAGGTGLAVATRREPVGLVRALLPHLAPSAGIAVYGPYVQPMARLAAALRSCGAVTAVAMVETAVARHQVAPGRTHPEMSDGGVGGYVVTAIKVATD
ncbi:hypothetical protein I4F81_011584 [Pyropia yezoensis]|uniref:Uncharacterized protein n=1 Tax=Pyropia yezoensis TaxID=2788 RepID=A0ACC3CFZ1_PYRYE|nr:hypothetical protein I4F81_011584 [Neopyropia yezoensis]